MAATLEERLSELEARDAIKELTAAYCWHVARAEAEALTDLFVEDGGLAFADDRPPVLGRDALLALYQTVKPGSLIPIIHNHIIRIEGKQASGTCVVESRVPDGGFVAYYHDTYRRVDGKWKFVVRRFEYYIPPPPTSFVGEYFAEN